ncbi:50S ribosomal protein L11 [bacterium]|nr:50S ribosomal protein L11 [bacterium]
MAKEVTKIIKLQLPAGSATPAPPVGTALGPAGVNIAQFVKEFNDASRPQMGNVLPVILTVYKDRTFSFIMKKPPASRLLLKAMAKESGSGKPNSQKIGKISKSKLKELAELKMEDMNTASVEGAMKLLAGTARSMGLEVEA